MNRREMILGGLGIAIVFVATLYIKIPNPIDGYFNLGDGFIMLFSSILSPLPAFIVGGLGSAMADVAGGYTYYFFYTLVIKGIEALVISYLFKRYSIKIKWLAYSLGSIIMVIGYALAKWHLKGSLAIAITGIPENIIQSAVGFVIAITLLPTITKLYNSKTYKGI